MKKEMQPSAVDWKNRIKEEILAAQRVVVLTVGNISKGDDAAGILCAQELKKRIGRRNGLRLKILIGYETPENMTGEIRGFRPDLVLILDAAQGGYKPGTVFMVGKGQIEDDGVSTHAISLALLVTYLEKTIGCKVIVLGIQPFNLGLGEGVSSPVRKTSQKLAAYLANVFSGKCP